MALSGRNEVAHEGLALWGHDLFGNKIEPPALGPIRQRFLIPPFSLLDARAGEWQERKRAWLALGIKSELGRDPNLIFKGTSIVLRPWKYDKFAPEEQDQCAYREGTSIFDPVLCELAYRWFCPQGGQVVDPFAGGSVRGIVAAAVGLPYWGCDLSAEQIAANRAQQAEINAQPPPEWVHGDSADMLAAAPDADFIFSCPPYGDLEKYSDDPRDLSKMDAQGFRRAYGEIISSACKRLKNHRFATFVVGDYRGKDGFLIDLVGMTIAFFSAAGLRLYNHAILSTPTGSAALRAGRIFDGGRKLVKIHQNLLVFCKGDWRLASAAAMAVEDEPEPEELPTGWDDVL